MAHRGHKQAPSTFPPKSVFDLRLTAAAVSHLDVMNENNALLRSAIKMLTYFKRLGQYFCLYYHNCHYLYSKLSQNALLKPSLYNYCCCLYCGGPETEKVPTLPKHFTQQYPIKDIFPKNRLSLL